MKNLILIAFLGITNFVIGQSINQPLRLKVCSYNIGHFNQGTLGGFQGNKGHVQAEINNWKQWIGTQAFDILAVNEWNEYFDKDSLFKADEHILQPFYKNIYFGPQKRWIYNGLATNHILSNIREVTLDGDYYAVLGDLKIGDKIVTIISVHVPWQKDWHNRSLEALIEELKKHEYFICMGDMNAFDTNQLKFIQAGFNMANGGAMGWVSTAAAAVIKSGRKGESNTNIDNIVTSSNIKIFNVSAPKTGLNDLDHLPVIAELVITW